MDEKKQNRLSHCEKKACGPQTARVLQSEELLKESREVFIRHAGELYRLIVTKNDKLILQK